MKKNYVQNIVVHESETSNIPNQIAKFQAQLIARRLDELCLSSADKVLVLDQILDALNVNESIRIAE